MFHWQLSFLKGLYSFYFVSFAKLRKRCNTAIEGVENIVWATNICKKQRLSSKVTYKRRNGDFWMMRQTVANIYPDLCSKGRKKGVTLQQKHLIYNISE